jgi:hypothetical protein
MGFNVGHMPEYLQKGLLRELTNCLRDMGASGWINIDKDGDISSQIDGDNKPAIFSELTAITARWNELHFKIIDARCGLKKDTELLATLEGVASERELEMVTKFVYAPSPPIKSTVADMDKNMSIIQELKEKRTAEIRETKMIEEEKIKLERNARRKEAAKNNISRGNKYVESSLKPSVLPTNYHSPPVSDDNSSGDEKRVKKVKRRDTVIETVSPVAESKNSAKKAAKKAAKLSSKK